LHGPAWLPTQPTWPTWNHAEVLLTCLELGYVDHVHSEQTKLDQDPPVTHTVARIIDINKFSCLSKLVAVTAYVLWFINHAKHNNSTHLLPAEISLACVKWIYSIQHEHFLAEIKNLCTTVTAPVTPSSVTAEIILRQRHVTQVRHNALLSELARFPYLLPLKHGFTNLVILQAHSPQWHQ